MTFPEFAGLYTSYFTWREDIRLGPSDQGRNVLTVEIGESCAQQALDCAEWTVRELAAASMLDLGKVDLLVATASVAGFAAELAKRLGVSAERVALPSHALAGAHTAALAVALESVRPKVASTALFVSVGAGITVVATLYRDVNTETLSERQRRALDPGYFQSENNGDPVSGLRRRGEGDGVAEGLQLADLVALLGF